MFLIYFLIATTQENNGRHDCIMPSKHTQDNLRQHISVHTEIIKRKKRKYTEIHGNVSSLLTDLRNCEFFCYLLLATCYALVTSASVASVIEYNNNRYRIERYYTRSVKKRAKRSYFTRVRDMRCKEHKKKRYPSRSRGTFIEEAGWKRVIRD